jgi:hypothetical protein
MRMSMISFVRKALGWNTLIARYLGLRNILQPGGIDSIPSMSFKRSMLDFTRYWRAH